MSFRVGEDTLVLDVLGRRIELPLESVLLIRTRTRDSLNNGALIGALVLGSRCALVCGQGLDDADSVPLVVARNAVFGAAVVAAVDGSIAGRATIYRKPQQSTLVRAPRASVLVSFRF